MKISETQTLLLDESREAVQSQIEALNDAAFALHLTAPDETIRLADQITSLSESIGSEVGIASANNLRGIAARAQSRYSDALRYFQCAIDSYKAAGETRRLAGVVSNMGIVHAMTGDLVRGLRHYLDALNVAESIEDTVLIANVCTNIGTLYAQQGDFSPALIYLERALALHQSLNNPNHVAMTQISIGDLYLKKKEFDSALRYLRPGLRYCGRSGNRNTLAIGFCNLLTLYRQQEKWSLCLRYGHAALIITRQLENLDLAALTLNDLSTAYRALSRSNDARAAAEEALQIGIHLDMPSHRRDAHQSLSQIYEIRGDLPLALFHLKESVRAADQQRERERQEQFRELQVREETEAAHRAAEQEREKNRLLEMLAHTDDLTRLPNRRKMNRQIAGELKRAEQEPSYRFTMGIADIDHFKEINDRLGHDGGDVILIQMAERLAAMLEGIGIAARWGGEEFCLLIPGLGEAETLAHLQLFLSDLNTKPFLYQGASHWVSMTIGVTAYRPGDTTNDLLRRADAALYEGKSRGRSQVLVTGGSP